MAAAATSWTCSAPQEATQVERIARVLGEHKAPAPPPTPAQAPATPAEARILALLA